MNGRSIKSLIFFKEYKHDRVCLKKIQIIRKHERIYLLVDVLTSVFI